MRIAIYHATAGYGHKKIAEVIREELLIQGMRAEHVKVEDSLDFSPDWFKKFYTGFYFYSVKYAPLLWGWGYELLDQRFIDQLTRPIRSLWNQWVGKKLLDRVLNDNPDVIICTHFYSAELFAKARLREKLAAKLITVITDFYPHNFWINPGTDYYWVMSEEGAHELEERGIPAFRIKTGGIPVGRDFLPKGNKEAVLKKWNFDPARFTLLITSGSFGLGPTLEILNCLEFYSNKIQVFVVCANNKKLEEQVKSKSYNFPIQVFGFIDFMPDLMEASDIMVAKPGGSTSCESLVKGIPMVVLRPIPGQESRNADLLRERNTSFFIESAAQIKDVLNSIFNNPSMLRDMKKEIRELAKPEACRQLSKFAAVEVMQPVN